jgi:hypothetical protein
LDGVSLASSRPYAIETRLAAGSPLHCHRLRCSFAQVRARREIPGRLPARDFDVNAGRRLRDEVVGDSRDVNISIEKFLGRQRSIEPFLKKIGVN